MRKPTMIIMYDSDVKPTELGFGFTVCHSCATELFIPQKSKIYLFLINLWFGFKNGLKHHTRVTNVYVCPVCNTRHIYVVEDVHI